MKHFHEKFQLRFNINIPKISDWKLGSLKYNLQSLGSTCDKNCVGTGIFFYFKNDGKPIYIIYLKEDTLLLKNDSSVIFIECNKINWKTSDVNGFCISIL